MPYQYKTLSVSDIPQRMSGRPPGRWGQLEQFLLSQPEGIAVEVELNEGETAKQAAETGRTSLRRGGGDIKFCQRGDKLFAYRNGNHPKKAL